MRNDVDYQYFRDFAENKGAFTVGATNIPIKNKQGEIIGTMLKDVPMIDFSSASRKHGIATAIAPQYIVSVAHNKPHYNSVQFGASDNHPDAHHFDYKVTDFNDYPDGLDGLDKDYHQPRLHKLITEIIPTPVTSAGLDNKIYLNQDRFSHFVRVGSGLQIVRSKDKPRQIVSEWYQYLTGGTPLRVTGDRYGWVDANGDVFTDHYGPLITYGITGDSGSSLWAFDKQENRWVQYGVLNFSRGEHGGGNVWSITRADWNTKQQQADNAGIIINKSPNATFHWSNTSASSSVVSRNGRFLRVNLNNPSLTEANALNHGKTVYFKGQTGTLKLTQNINQGAGALYFDADFTVKGINNNTTWQGAGVSVAKGKTVHWQVKNPTSDRLSKIGEGTLVVNGKGSNTGDISVGDGTVVLNQTGGQAFNHLGIVSGRPTVRLDGDNQINPNNIYFGFRGGRLDVNGHDLTFNRIQNVDDGARVVNNHPSKTTSITLKGLPTADINSLSIADRVHANQDLYRWDKRHTHAKQPYDYFLPKNGRINNHPYYPTNQQSNEHWEYLGDNLDNAQKIALQRKNERSLITAFNGYFGETDSTKHNGKLNVTFTPTNPRSTLLLSGGTRLNGNLTANGGTLVLSGRPVPHAYDHLKNTDVIYEDDWLNRTFNATNFIANNNATVFVGRNVSAVNTNLTANNNATFNLGVIQGTTPECIRSDHTGVVNCDNKTLSEKALVSSPVLDVRGNSQLNDNSKLNLGKAHLTGRIQGTGNVSLQADSRWTMTDNSTVKNLDLKGGANVHLNGTDAKHHTLNIQGDLSGVGRFYLNSNITQNSTDKIIVSGIASGTHTLHVNNTGREPKLNELELLKVGTKGESLSVALGNGHVDLGTFRYSLFEKANSYVLGVAHRNALTAPTVGQVIAKPKKPTRKKVQRPKPNKYPKPHRYFNQYGRRPASAFRMAFYEEAPQRDYISRYANIGLSELSAQVGTLVYVNHQLDQEIINHDQHGLRAWVQFGQQKSKQGSDLYRPYQQSINLTQFGIEQRVGNDITVGSVFSHSSDHSQFDDGITGKHNLKQINLYTKKMWNNGIFTAIEGGYASSRTKLGNQVTFKRHIFSLSSILGKDWIVNNVTFKPSIGVRYYHLSKSNYAFDNANIGIKPIDMISYQAGFSLSKIIQLGELKFKPEISSYFVDASLKKLRVNVNQNALQQQFGRYIKTEITSMLQNNNWNISIGLGFTKGNEIKNQRFATLKLGYNW
ncbi:S6 family peptidase [Ursidibacter maritimus]|uniref:S6 family peptidase n=1 Tax=Ursidibacter maritimus TaxID=1331689 RepID=UPI001C43AF9A